MSLSALVLAGSRPGRPDPVALAEGLCHKALADIGGQPKLARGISAPHGARVARGAGGAREPQGLPPAPPPGARDPPPQAGPSASVAAAFDRMGAPLLVTTSDHALLQGAWVRDFLADMPAGADVALLLARRDAVEAAQPGARRTWLRFADGQWSGCNLFLLANPAARAAIATWEAVEENRKRPWRIAARLGVRTLLDYALGRLALADAVARLGARIGISAAMVPARDGLAAVDVDKPEDLAAVRAIVAARRI